MKKPEQCWRAPRQESCIMVPATRTVPLKMRNKPYNVGKSPKHAACFPTTQWAEEGPYNVQMGHFFMDTTTPV